MPSAQRAERPQREVSRNSGGEIRAKIEANRQKRLAIAEAMKAEAGVTGHEVNWEDFSGLAYIGTGRIYSPQGRNMRQLYVVAHECGHIFLHGAAPGNRLPGHVMEFEAESYAHQAFQEHGMKLPRALSKWGRQYVKSWIDKDRAAGIPIDPRAEAYALGTRSAYEPLRMVPETWAIFRAAPQPQAPALATAAIQKKAGIISTMWAEARELLSDAFRGAPTAAAVCIVGLVALRLYAPVEDILAKRPDGLFSMEFQIAVCGALLWANLVVLWRTLTR